jgi:hypothetical protein
VSRDCPDGELCILSGSGANAGVCRLPDETKCGVDNQCQTGLVCGPDGQCRNECTTAQQCIPGQVCVDKVCADHTEVGSNGHLLGAGDGGTVSVPHHDAGGEPVVHTDAGHPLPHVDAGNPVPHTDSGTTVIPPPPHDAGGGVVAVLGTTGVASTSGGGLGQSTSYSAWVSVGAPAPYGLGSSNNFTVALGTPRPR